MSFENPPSKKVTRVEHIESDASMPKNIEETANYEGNDTELLTQRVSSPHIRNQIIDLLYKNALDTYEDFQQAVPDPLLDGFVKGPSGTSYPKSADRKPPSKEVFANELDVRLHEVASFTPVSFERDATSNMDAIAVAAEFQGTEQQPNTKQMSIIEAHEKGHVLRPYRGHSFDVLFKKGFDLSQVRIERGDPLVERMISQDQFPRNQYADTKAIEKYLLDDVRKDILEYLFSAHEIAERMSQLKNYFGMHGDEMFTSSHLAYAREHYVRDTGMDNNMSQFFQAITPETQDAFIELINTMGI